MCAVGLRFITYRAYILYSCGYFFLFIIMADAIVVCFMNILCTMPGLLGLIGIHVYLNCVCRLLKVFFKENSKVLLF